MAMWHSRNPSSAEKQCETRTGRTEGCASAEERFEGLYSGEKDRTVQSVLPHRSAGKNRRSAAGWTAVQVRYTRIITGGGRCGAGIYRKPACNPYSTEDLANGGNGYLPITLQYRPYTAKKAREVSIAGGDFRENFTNRSYFGKTNTAYNEADLDNILECPPRDGRQAR